MTQQDQQIVTAELDTKGFGTLASPSTVTKTVPADHQFAPDANVLKLNIRKPIEKGAKDPEGSTNVNDKTITAIQFELNEAIDKSNGQLLQDANDYLAREGIKDSSDKPVTIDRETLICGTFGDRTEALIIAKKVELNKQGYNFTEDGTITKDFAKALYLSNGRDTIASSTLSNPQTAPISDFSSLTTSPQIGLGAGINTGTEHQKELVLAAQKQFKVEAKNLLERGGGLVNLYIIANDLAKKDGKNLNITANTFAEDGMLGEETLYCLKAYQKYHNAESRGADLPNDGTIDSKMAEHLLGDRANSLMAEASKPISVASQTVVADRPEVTRQKYSSDPEVDATLAKIVKNNGGLQKGDKVSEYEVNQQKRNEHNGLTDVLGDTLSKEEIMLFAAIKELKHSLVVANNRSNGELFQTATTISKKEGSDIFFAISALPNSTEVSNALLHNGEVATLKFGERNDSAHDVRGANNFLSSEFDNHTELAVRAFQQIHSLNETGVADGPTLQKLYQVVSSRSN